MVDTFTPEQITQILEEFFKVVGTRRYVGERYVPIFGRKGEESIQWDNSAPYEPLTIVLYQGNSYTSRQYVPIGVDITNQEFWVITGNYNAQIEAYHRETIAAREIADNAITTANNAQNDIDTLLPKGDFSAENTVKKYIDENPTRILTFDTVADMQAATYLKNGMTCHTNGFHASGDGGAAYYTVNASGTANDMDILALQGGLYATLIVTEPYVTPEQFGAYGDGTHNDAAYIQRAIDYLKGGTVSIQPKVYAIGDTLVLHRGIILSGIAPYDTSTGYGCTLKRMDAVNKPVIQTPNAAGGDATHYMVLENLNIDGNGTEQTIETNTIEFYGAYIGSIIRNIRIGNYYGSGLSLRHTDLQIDHLWITDGYTLTGAYALDTGQGLPPSTRSSILNINHLYIENISNVKSGTPRTDETERADGLRLNQVASANINEFHCEGCRIPVTITNSWNIKINMLGAAYCGLSTDTYGAMIYLTTAVRQMLLMGLFTTDASNFAYWVSKGTSFSSNEIADAEYSGSYPYLPMYVVDGGGTDTDLWMSSPNFINNAIVQRVGSATTANYILRHPTLGDSRLRLNGEYTELGSSVRQEEFKVFLRAISTGNAGDRMELFTPIKLGERSSASSIYAGSLYMYTDARGTAPTYQRTTGSAATADKVVTARMLTSAPTESAAYVGEMVVDYSNKKVYVATSIGNGADDWSTII